MRHILVTNAKGGCGKSTIATSLAAYLASEGYSTALADFDPQASALSWLEQRPADYAPIAAVRGFESGLTHVPRSAEFVVIDSPAGSYGRNLTELVRDCGFKVFAEVVKSGGQVKTLVVPGGGSFSCERQRQAYQKPAGHKRAARTERPRMLLGASTRAQTERVQPVTKDALVSCNALLCGLSSTCAPEPLPRTVRLPVVRWAIAAGGHEIVSS